jgi:hypothetical protein
MLSGHCPPDTPIETEARAAKAQSIREKRSETEAQRSGKGKHCFGHGLSSPKTPHCSVDGETSTHHDKACHNESDEQIYEKCNRNRFEE